MKTIIQLLSTQRPAPDGGFSLRYFANGRRVSRAAYRDLQRQAICLDCMLTVKAPGFWRHYSSATFAQPPV